MDNKYNDVEKAINQFIDRVRSDINLIGKKIEEDNCINDKNCKSCKNCNTKPEEKTTDASKIGLSSPWYEYYHKLEALFGQDPEVHLSFSDKDMKIIFRVDNLKKYNAIEKLLPSVLSFGNVTVHIVTVPANTKMPAERTSLFADAFEGNPIFDKLITVRPDTPIVGGTKYLMFKKKVAQFFNDNLADPNGNSSYLYADLAEDVFGHVEGESLYYSTSEEE